MSLLLKDKNQNIFHIFETLSKQNSQKAGAIMGKGDPGVSFSFSCRHRHSSVLTKQCPLRSYYASCAVCPPFLFLDIGGSLFALCSGHMFTLHILAIYPDCLSLPTPLNTNTRGGRSVKVWGNLEALLLPETSPGRLNGGSVLGVHDTAVGTLVSAGKGHHDP